MKIVIVLLSLAFAVFALDVYPTKYDSIDIDRILANERLSNSYIMCLLKRGACTEEGGILRDVIPDALITGCSKCNAIQKIKLEKVLGHLIRHRLADFEALLALYDPQGAYRQKYQSYLDKFDYKIRF